MNYENLNIKPLTIDMKYDTTKLSKVMKGLEDFGHANYTTSCNIAVSKNEYIERVRNKNIVYDFDLGVLD